jgi:hypothetical protein
MRFAALLLCLVAVLPACLGACDDDDPPSRPDGGSDRGAATGGSTTADSDSSGESDSGGKSGSGEENESEVRSASALTDDRVGESASAGQRRSFVRRVCSNSPATRRSARAVLGAEPRRSCRRLRRALRSSDAGALLDTLTRLRRRSGGGAAGLAPP